MGVKASLSLGVYRNHAGSLQEVFGKYTGSMQVVHRKPKRKCTGIIQGMCNKCARSLQEVCREYTGRPKGIVQGVYRKYAGSI